MLVHLFPLVFAHEVKARLNHFQHVLQPGFIVLVLRQEQIGPPVGRVEAPVTRPVLLRAVRVTHELLRAEQPTAPAALDTARLRRSVQLGCEDAFTLAEALVVDLEAVGCGRVGGFLGRGVEQGVTQPLSVRLGDEAAAGRAERQHVRHLEVVELLGVTSRAEDVQVVTHHVNLLQAEVA